MSTGGAKQVMRGNLDRLLARIADARGVDLKQYRRSYLERRIDTRLRKLGVHSYRQYGDLLESDPAEYAQLMDTLTINVTEFFRDGVVWDAITETVIPAILQAKPPGRSRTIRIWSAGCATGQEPYSLAMALLDQLGDDAAQHNISILATDLDPEALAFAERGVYEVAKGRRIPPRYQVRFTREIDATHLEITPEIKRLVRFRKASLFEDTPFRVIDLILCRNVFIYFDHQQQAMALDRFWNSLTRGGYLVLGRSEKLSVAAARCFESVNGRERVYRKPDKV